MKNEETRADYMLEVMNENGTRFDYVLDNLLNFADYLLHRYKVKAFSDLPPGPLEDLQRAAERRSVTLDYVSAALKETLECGATPLDKWLKMASPALRNKFLRQNEIRGRRPALRNKLHRRS